MALPVLGVLATCGAAPPSPSGSKRMDPHEVQRNLMRYLPQLAPFKARKDLKCSRCRRRPRAHEVPPFFQSRHQIWPALPPNRVQIHTARGLNFAGTFRYCRHVSLLSVRRFCGRRREPRGCAAEPPGISSNPWHAWCHHARGCGIWASVNARRMSKNLLCEVAARERAPPDLPDTSF